MRLAIAAMVPLSPDEAYYWVWSRALAPGYPDHPPMVALWISAGTWLAGDGPLGVRLLAPLSAALGSLLLVQAGADLAGSRRAGIAAALLLNATLLFGLGAVTLTPDTPLLLFWTATLWALGRLLATGRGLWWLAAGVAAGLALDSKYSAALLAPVVLAWLLTVPRLRYWLRRPDPWLGVLAASAVFAPVLAWNAAHGWVSLLRQGGRLGAWEPSRAGQFVAELLGGQLGLATPLLAGLFVAGIAQATRRAWRGEAAATLLALATLLPAAVFLQHALGDRVQANWPAVIYPAAALAAATAPRWHVPAVALGAVLTLLVYAQAAFAPLPVPPRLDPVALRLAGWPALAGEVARTARDQGAAFVATDEYSVAAEFARLLPPALPVVGVDARWALLDLPDGRGVLAGRAGLLLRAQRNPLPPDPATWASAQPLGERDRAGGAMAGERYLLYRVVGGADGAPAAVLPRPR